MVSDDVLDIARAPITFAAVHMHDTIHDSNQPISNVDDSSTILRPYMLYVCAQ